MNSLFKAIPFKQLARLNPTVMYNVASRKYADYRLDELVPGPYPKTKEEREAAAKKYGLLPHEYEPFPDDGFGRGDYPKLPDIGGDARGEHYPWDYPVHRRDYNETWHAFSHLIHMDRDNPQEHKDYPRPMWQMISMYISCVAAYFLLFYIFEDYKMGVEVLEKQWPHKPGPHYTFEPAELD